MSFKHQATGLESYARRFKSSIFIVHFHLIYRIYLPSFMHVPSKIIFPLRPIPLLFSQVTMESK